jgi:hypothetical protein
MYYIHMVNREQGHTILYRTRILYNFVATNTADREASSAAQHEIPCRAKS